ncbi:MAG TPA: nicotinate (nicotinamide) nucleotide adenylyltransferase [Solirubrobacteraceae bacterium]|nr:nicotinate (nicotinamide) nucleotide adenylyltransferase [Solirubrobacteraceae bacterium]
MSVSVGILGGTFNPPHLGHLQIARRALDQLQLGRVLLMPARMNPLKPGEEDPGPRHRLAMCELLSRYEPQIDACAAELSREGPSFTVETLRELHRSHPSVGWTFIAGADAAATLPRWRDPAGLLSLASLAVAARAGSSREQVLEAVAQVTGGDGRARVSFLEMPLEEVSSSQVRERVGRGEPVAELVGEPVSEYIAEHGLYREAS